MAQDGDPPKSKRSEKDAALAAALRANLRRRKAGGGKSAPPSLAKTPGKDDPP